jgi:hypothetical protein
MPKLTVFNKTDGVFASPQPFDSDKEARKFIREFRDRFKLQGYYLTSSGERIDPEAVILEVQEGE